VTQKLFVSDVLKSEAFAVLLATRLTAFMGNGDFMLERDALLVILAVNQLHLFSFWHFAPLISDIRLDSLPLLAGML
jgi:hypothetical protein